MMPLSDIFAAIRWWAVLMLLGTAALPLTYTLFRQLPDRGYAFVKMVGLLVVSYLFWLLGSLGLLGNNVGGILFALSGLVALSVWVYQRERRTAVVLPDGEAAPGADDQPTLRAWLRDNRSQVILTELVFALAFALWVWVRAQNPAISATEKPMEFAFLNSVGRSPVFPPLDPWLSGYAISYYYFGYVMTSVIARLAAVPEPVAFNLGIAWLLAGTAVGAFGLIYNLVADRARRSAVVLGVIAAVALPIAGNLEIVLEVMHANGVGSAAFWQWLDVRDLNRPPAAGQPARYDSTSWWWWRSSRVIHEYTLDGRAEEGLEPIAEFPGFSFVLGDMHPHVLALPFAFLSLAVAYAWWRESGDWRLGTGGWRLMIANVKPFGSAQVKSPASNPSLLLFTALALGGLSFLNTWDVLIHLFIVLGAFVLAQWYTQGWHERILWQAAIMGLLLAAAALLLYLPFYLGFRSQASAPYLLPMLMRPTRLPHFLTIFGMPLWSITILLLALTARQWFLHWQAGVVTAVVVVGGLLLLMFLFGWLIASSPDGIGRLGNLAAELDRALPPRPEGNVAPGWGLTAVFAILPTVLAAKLTYPGVTLLLATLLGLVVMSWLAMAPTISYRIQEPDSEIKLTLSPPYPFTPSPLPFVLLLIATGALLTLGPEFVYLRDNFGVRLNTVFKFYYQAWVLFGVAALFALAYLWHEFLAGAQRLAPALATTGYGIALLLALLFPIYAIRSRAEEYRGPVTADMRQPATLNGLAQLGRYNPDDYDAILWLRQNVENTPVVLEAVGGQYSPEGHGRVSASTGLPTVLGWAGHENQWRGSSMPEPGLRDPVVREIYTQPSWDSTAELLNRYNVQYVYVGPLEVSTYGPQSREKFSGRLPVVYENNSVTIYRWYPQ